MARQPVHTSTRHSWKLCLPVLALLTLAGAAAGETPAVKVLANLAYRSGTALTPYEEDRCKLDLYLPGSGPGFASLVWFHGGGLTAGSKDSAQTAAVARALAETGVAVASVNYRLSPKAKYPAYIEDGAAALAWVKAHIAEHGGDPGKVFIGGHSAGAYLTLMLGLDEHYVASHGLKLGDIAGLVPVAGQTLTHYTVRIERGLPKDTIIADAASPLHHARKDAPPILILYAEKDMAMRAQENELLAAALRAAGHERLAVRMIPGTNHGSVGHNLARSGDPGRDFVLSFIRQPNATSP